MHSQEASYEIQFGHLKRATHFNTSFEVARFEANAHKWIDLSQPEYGVSLFTNNKYGYSVHGKVMRISLVRAPTSPDPEADQGRHTFKYGCYAHPGSLIEAQTVRRAHEFSQPWVTQKGTIKAESFYRVSSAHLIIDTIKKAEASDATILRLYETHGAKGSGLLKIPPHFKKVELVNMMEENPKVVPYKDGNFELKFKPFEIVTLKLS